MLADGIAFVGAEGQQACDVCGTDGSVKSDAVNLDQAAAGSAPANDAAAAALAIALGGCVGAHWAEPDRRRRMARPRTTTQGVS